MKAAKEYYAIKNKFGDDGVISFIGDIAMLRASGMVDAEKMLHYIYHHRPKKDRKKAFKEYREWIEN